MKDIPMPYVKANQAGIVAFVLTALLTGFEWLIAVLFLIEAAGYFLGLRYNLFVAAARPFLRTEGKETQAAELTRFNNSLALLFLTLYLVAWAAGWQAAGYVFAVMLALAAGIALFGYCIGCTVYFQYKQLKARLRTR